MFQCGLRFPVLSERKGSDNFSLSKPFKLLCDTKFAVRRNRVSSRKKRGQSRWFDRKLGSQVGKTWACYSFPGCAGLSREFSLARRFRNGSLFTRARTSSVISSGLFSILRASFCRLSKSLLVPSIFGQTNLPRHAVRKHPRGGACYWAWLPPVRPCSLFSAMGVLFLADQPSFGLLLGRYFLRFDIFWVGGHFFPHRTRPKWTNLSAGRKEAAKRRGGYQKSPLHHLIRQAAGRCRQKLFWTGQRSLFWKRFSKNRPTRVNTLVPASRRQLVTGPLVTQCLPPVFWYLQKMGSPKEGRVLTR